MSEELVLKQESGIFKLFDELDDRLIEDELKGAISDAWVYEFMDRDGKPIIGLSKVGIDQASIILTKQGNIIREDTIDYKQDPTNPEYFLFTATVTQYAIRNDGQEFMLKRKIGTKRQWTKMIARGKIVEDPFWFEKGSMKAIRNATARLIDEELKSNIIALAKQQKKVKVISENELHQVEAAKEKAKPKAYEENPELAKFWMSFKSIFDYEKYKAELNGLLHKLLTLHFKKQSLREKGIDYGKFLMILLEDTEMQKYLKAKTEVEQAPIFEGDEI